LITKTRGDYLSNRAWFKDVLHGQNVILCHGSALEYLQLFMGYLNEYEIDVYALEKGIYKNINYRTVNAFSNIDTVRIGNLLCTSVNQTINDMLDDFNNTDEQALLEALNEYYHMNNQSFRGLVIQTRNIKLFENIKNWAIEYNDGGIGHNDRAGNTYVSNIR